MGTKGRFDVNKPHLGGNVIGGDPKSFTPKLWDFLISKYSIKTVVDVGCGEGNMIEYCHKKGLRCFGIDGLQENINVVKSKGMDGVVCDYSKEEFTQTTSFDLCWCCEFVEHVESAFVNNFLNTFAKCNVIAMTHATPRQGGYHHVNCQPSSYWIKLVENKGFLYDDAISKECRELAKFQNHKAYFARTGLVFKKIS